MSHLFRVGLMASLMAGGLFTLAPQSGAAQWIELDVPDRPDPASVDLE